MASFAAIPSRSARPTSPREAGTTSVGWCAGDGLNGNASHGDRRLREQIRSGRADPYSALNGPNHPAMRRGIPGWKVPPSYTFFVLERSFFMVDVIVTVIGFVLPEGYLNNTDGRVLARTGATTYLFAGIMLVAAEALFLSPGFGPGFEKRGYALIVVCVVLAFLAQAAMWGAR